MDAAKYDLNAYRAEVESSSVVYDDLIFHHTHTFDGAALTIKPLSDNEIFEAKRDAGAARAQFLSAAGKRLRRGAVLRALDVLSKEYDITPTLAVRLSKSLLGRAVDRKILMDRYGKPGRDASNKSKDFANIEVIVVSESFKSQARELGKLLDEAAKIRSGQAKTKTKAFDWLSASAQLAASSRSGNTRTKEPLETYRV